MRWILQGKSDSFHSDAHNWDSLLENIVMLLDTEIQETP